MNFSTDRDLLAHEPTLFADVAWVSQRRLRVDDAMITDTTLTSSAANFIKAGVEAGSVVLIDQTPHEVVARVDAHTLTISLIRGRVTDAPLPGVEGGPFELTVRTFQPQAAAVHDGLLRLVGIHPPGDGPAALALADGRLTEDAIVSLSTMTRLETLGTLERVYGAAAALLADNTLVLHKANEYRRRFRHAVGNATVLIDTNGDGLPEERRRLGVVRFARV